MVGAAQLGTQRVQLGVHPARQAHEPTFRELSALFIADQPRGSTDEPRYRIAVVVLAHVDGDSSRKTQLSRFDRNK